MHRKPNSLFNTFFLATIILLIASMFYNNYFAFSFEKDKNYNLVNSVLEEIQKNYVDSLNMDSMVESSIRQILTNLDPHSIYMNRDEVSSSMEMMQGSFEGIGIEFSIHKDTIIIVNVIPNGPSEKKGIQAGGRIIMIEGEKVAGIGIRNQDVIKKFLRNVEKWNFEEEASKSSNDFPSPTYEIIDETYFIKYKIYINDQPQGLPLDHTSTLENTFEFWEKVELKTNNQNARIIFEITPSRGDANVWVTYVGT